MTTPKVSQALRDALAMQSAATKFYRTLALAAVEQSALKQLRELMRMEQRLEVKIETVAPQLTNDDIAARPTAGVARIKTAPEWSSLPVSSEQALAIALGCTTRSAHHHAEVADTLDGPAGAFFRALAVSELDRARVLEERLHQGLGELVTSRPLALAVTDVLISIRKAARAYDRLSKSTSSPSARLFLVGMFEVCMLHAAEADRYASELVDRPVVVQSVFDAENVAAPLVFGGEVNMDFETAMRTAVAAQKRASLVHDMLARAYPGDGAGLFFDIAEAERQHARTILQVLDRLYPTDTVDDDADPSSPLAVAPRQTWSYPPSVSRIGPRAATPLFALPTRNLDFGTGDG